MKSYIVWSNLSMILFDLADSVGGFDLGTIMLLMTGETGDLSWLL